MPPERITGLVRATAPADVQSIGTPGAAAMHRIVSVEQDGCVGGNCRRLPLQVTVVGGSDRLDHAASQAGKARHGFIAVELNRTEAELGSDPADLVGRLIDEDADRLHERRQRLDDGVRFVQAR